MAVGLGTEFTTLCNRGDGRIEIVCSHGVGHPSKVLSEARYGLGSWKAWMDVHGCDGCCFTHSAVFGLLELAEKDKFDQW